MFGNSQLVCLPPVDIFVLFSSSGMAENYQGVAKPIHNSKQHYLNIFTKLIFIDSPNLRRTLAQLFFPFVCSFFAKLNGPRMKTVMTNKMSTVTFKNHV